MALARVFMDTAGFQALWDAGDEHHERAVHLQSELAKQGRQFLTTDYVVDEAATLLLLRHSHEAAADFLRTATSSRSLEIQWVSADRFHRAAKLFERYDDKEWSFTDCVSFEVMRELGIADCFTTDHHFRQAGFNPLLGSPAA